MAQQGSSVINEIRVRVIAEGGYQILDQYGRKIGEYNKATAQATERTSEWSRAATASGQAIRDMGEAFAKSTIGMKAGQSGLDEFGDIAFKFNNIISQVQPVMELLAGRMKAAFDAGTEWQKGMANVGTVIDVVGTAAEKQAASIEQLQAAAKSYGEAIKPILLNSNVPTEEALRGAYDVLSAGFTDSADAVKIFDSAVKLAVTTLGTVPEAVDTITSVLNAYKMSADDATAVTNAFVVAAQYGKLTLDELNVGIGKVIPVAAQLGVPLEEIAAGIATITQSGVPAAEAETNMRMAMVSLLKPTKEMTKLVKSLGYETGQEMIASEGLKNTLEKLSQATLGSESSFALAFSRVQGMNAATILGSLNSARYGEVLQATTNAMVTAGLESSQLEKRYGIQMKTTASLWEVTKKFFEELKRQQFEELESALKSVLNGLIYIMDGLRAMSTSENPFDRLIKATGTWMIGLGALLAAITVGVVNFLSKFYLAKVAIKDMQESWNGFLAKTADGGNLTKQTTALGAVGSAEDEVLATEQARFSLAGQMNALLMEQQKIIAKTAAEYAASDKAAAIADTDTRYLRSIGVKPGASQDEIRKARTGAFTKDVATARADRLDAVLPSRLSGEIVESMRVDMSKGKDIDKIKRILGGAQAQLTDAFSKMTSDSIAAERDRLMAEYTKVSKKSDKAALDKAGLTSIAAAEAFRKRMAEDIEILQKRYRLEMVAVTDEMGRQFEQQFANTDMSAFVKNNDPMQATKLNLTGKMLDAHRAASPGQVVSPDMTPGDKRFAQGIADAGKVDTLKKAIDDIEKATVKSSNAFKTMGSIAVRSFSIATTAAILFSDSLDEMAKEDSSSGAAARWIQSWGLGIAAAMSTLGPEFLAGVMTRLKGSVKALDLVLRQGFDFVAVAKMWFSGANMTAVEAAGAEAIGMLGASWRGKIKSMLTSLGATVAAHPFGAIAIAIAVAIGAIWWKMSSAMDKVIEDFNSKAVDFNKAAAKVFTLEDDTRAQIVADYEANLKGTLTLMAAKADASVKAAVAEALGKKETSTTGMASRIASIMLERLFENKMGWDAAGKRTRKDPYTEALSRIKAEQDKATLDFYAARSQAINLLIAQQKVTDKQAQEMFTVEDGPLHELLSSAMIAIGQFEKDAAAMNATYIRVAAQVGTMMRGGTDRIIESARAAGKISPDDLERIRGNLNTIYDELASSQDQGVSEKLVKRLFETIAPVSNDVDTESQALIFAVQGMVKKLVTSYATTFDNEVASQLMPAALASANKAKNEIINAMEIAVGGIISGIESVEASARIEEALADAFKADPTLSAVQLRKATLRSQEEQLSQAKADAKYGIAGAKERMLQIAKDVSDTKAELAGIEAEGTAFVIASINKQIAELDRPPVENMSYTELEAKRIQTERDATRAILQKNLRVALDKQASAKARADYGGVKGEDYVEAKGMLADMGKKSDGIDKDIADKAKRYYDAAKDYSEGAAKIREAFENNIKAGSYTNASGLIEDYVKMRKAEVEYQIRGADEELAAVNAALAKGGGKDPAGLEARRISIQAQLDSLKTMQKTGDYDAAELRTKLLTVNDTIDAKNLMDIAKSYDSIASSMASFGDTTGAAAATTQSLNKQIEALSLQAQVIQANLKLAKTPDEVNALSMQAAENAAKAKALTEQLSVTQSETDNIGSLAAKKFIDNTRQAGDMMNQFADAGAEALGSFSDALVDYANGAKVSFGEMARSILADLTKIAVKMALMKMLDAAFGGGGVAATTATSGAGSASLNGTSLSWNQGSYNAGRFDTGGYIGTGGRKVQVTAHEGEAIFTPRQMANADKLFRAAAGSAGGGSDMKVVVNNYGNDQVEARKATGPDGQDYMEIIVKQAEQKMQNRMDRGTGMAPYLESKWGMSRRPGRTL